MTDWMASPVNGYYTITPSGRDEPEPPPVRLQGPEPDLRLRTAERVTPDVLGRGVLNEFVLDGERIDLSASRLEVLALGPTGELVFLICTDESPVDGCPVRLRLRLADVVEYEDADMITAPDFRAVDALQHDGHGSFRLSCWGDGFPAAVFGASAMELTVEVLDARRPPYVLVMAEYGTDGLWDLATADWIIKDPVDVDDLDLTDDLRDRFRVWNERWERGRTRRGEADRLAAELRTAWPESTVVVH